MFVGKSKTFFVAENKHSTGYSNIDHSLSSMVSRLTKYTLVTGKAVIRTQVKCTPNVRNTMLFNLVWNPALNLGPIIDPRCQLFNRSIIEKERTYDELDEFS